MQKSNFYQPNCMSEELPLGTEAPATPNPESESTDSETFESLFADDSSDNEEAPTREEFNRLKKGVAKFFTEQGMKKSGGEEKDKATEEPKGTSSKTSVSPVLKSLYFKSNPEAEMVWSQVEKEAENLKKDPFELYESSTYFKGEAKAMFERKSADEDAKSRVGMPSSLVKGGKMSYDRIDLGNADHIKWLNEKPERRTEYNNWLKANWKR